METLTQRYFLHNEESRDTRYWLLRCFDQSCSNLYQISWLRYKIVFVSGLLSPFFKERLYELIFGPKAWVHASKNDPQGRFPN